MSYVTIHYGPYEAHGVVRHRKQRLRGLEEQLELAGHTVELIPSPHWDRCVIEIGRRNIFHCRVTSFEYYGDGKGDVVCHRAMMAVNDAIVRIKPPFLYPDIRLFSKEFYEEMVVEIFRNLNVREYIHEAIEKAFAFSAVAECIEAAMDEAMTGEFIKHIIGEAMEEALLKDYMQGLIEANLQKDFEIHDFMADTIMDAVETRDFMKETIMEALTRTHPKIKEYTKDFIDKSFTNASMQLGLNGGSFIDIVKSVIDDNLSTSNQIDIKSLLNDLLENLSLRSKEYSLELRSTESPTSRSYNRSDTSFNHDGRASFYENSQESLTQSKSDSSRSN